MHHFRIGKKNSTQFCKRNSSIKLRKAPIVRNVIYNNVSVNFRVLFQATMGRNKKDLATTGAAVWENADEEDRQRVRDEGAAAWYEASEEEKERRKDVGAAAGGAAWENAVEEDRQRVRDEGAAAWYEASEEKNDRFSWVYKRSFGV